MTQRGPYRWVAAAAIVSIVFSAAAAQAESEQATTPSERRAQFHTVLLPQFIEPDPSHAGRPYKRSTLFQLDGSFFDGEADLLFRVQTGAKRLVFLRVRF